MGKNLGLACAPHCCMLLLRSTFFLLGDLPVLALKLAHALMGGLPLTVHYYAHALMGGPRKCTIAILPIAVTLLGEPPLVCSSSLARCIDVAGRAPVSMQQQSCSLHWRCWENPKI